MIPTFVPSLKHMAAVSVALLFYKTEDIQRFVKEQETRPFIIIMSDNISNEDWGCIKEATAEKMGLLLPLKLKPLVVEMLRPLHGELRLWKMDHYFFSKCSNKSNFSHLVSWRTDGTIDRTKTAKILIQNKSFSTVERFEMACTYFQENEILALWNEVRNKLPSENINILMRFWIRWITKGNEVNWIDMVDEHLGDPYQLNCFCPSGVNCFFRALSSENRRRYSSSLGNIIVHFDDLRFCFYQMDEIEKILLYQNSCQNILASLLRWPFQTTFLQAATNLWGYLKPDEFYFILRLIINQYILHDYQYFNFSELFKEFWYASPGSHKEHVQKKIDFFKVVELLLSFDEETHPFSMEEVMETITHDSSSDSSFDLFDYSSHSSSSDV